MEHKTRWHLNAVVVSDWTFSKVFCLTFASRPTLCTQCSVKRKISEHVSLHSYTKHAFFPWFNFCVMNISSLTFVIFLPLCFVQIFSMLHLLMHLFSIKLHIWKVWFLFIPETSLLILCELICNSTKDCQKSASQSWAPRNVQQLLQN